MSSVELERLRDVVEAQNLGIPGSGGIEIDDGKPDMVEHVVKGHFWSIYVDGR